MVLSRNSVSSIESNIRVSFKKIKEEMLDHLESINENTGEIQEIYKYFSEVDLKIEKLFERMDNISALARQFLPKQNIILDPFEQRLFLLLYTYGGTAPLSIYELSSKLSLSITFIKSCIQSMELKGIRLMKKLAKEDIYIGLNEEFKEMHARDNIVLIDENLKKSMCQNNTLLAFIS